MLLLALGIGFVLANNLLQLTPSRWQQIPVSDHNLTDSNP